MDLDQRDDKFEVGDLVRIRDWDDMHDEFPLSSDGDLITKSGVRFNTAMKKICGRQGYIRGVVPYKDGCFSVTLSCETGRWHITSEMIEYAGRTERQKMGFSEADYMLMVTGGETYGI